MNQSLQPVFLSLVSAIVGGTLAIGGQFSLKLWDERKKRKQLAQSLAAEVETYLHLIERRGFKPYFEEVLLSLRSGQIEKIGALFSPTDATLNAFPVAKSSIAEFGALGSLAGDVSRFYQYVLSIRLTWNAAADGSLDKFPPSEQARILETELSLWKEAEELGKILVKVLRAVT